MTKLFYHSDTPKRPDEYEQMQHRARVPVYLPPDEQVSFSWHFGCDANGQRILQRRMSGFELCQFIYPHIVNLTDSRMFEVNPRIEQELLLIRKKIESMTVDQLDEVLPWLQVVWRNEEDDIILLNLNQNEIVSSRRPTNFLPIGT